MSSYGLTKLALLNTAGYAKCVIPLDNSASICAPNNTGKSSVINALQFPLINDLRLTEWDGHDLEETRKFYFSTDQSYILLEANLPHGKVVIGVAGLGKIAGYGHQFFCYNGSLDLGHYTNEKTIIKFGRLFEHLNSLGHEPLPLKPAELNALLTGGATPFDTDINLKMIPLNNSSDAPVYKEIFRKILSLHKLGSQDVKRFMLRVFERHMSNARVDFFEVWNNAFSRVNRDRKELYALVAQKKAIEDLSSLLQHQAVLRGKIVVLAPKIDEGINQWQEYMEAAYNEASAQLEELLEEKARLEDQQRTYVNQLRDVERRSIQVEQWFNEYSDLAQQFELSTLETLQNNQASLKNDYDKLSGSLAGVQGQTSTSIEIRIQETKRSINRLELQLKNIEYNLFSRIREDLTVQEVEALSKIINPDLLSLATKSGKELKITDDEHFSALLEQLADSLKGGKFIGHGFELELSKLHAATMPSIEDKVSIQEQISALSSSLADLEQLAIVTKNVAGKMQERDTLYQQLLEAEQDIQQFQRFETMQDDLDDQEVIRERLQNDDEMLQTQLEAVQGLLASMSDRRNALAGRQDKLTRQNEQIARVKNERIDAKLILSSGDAVPYPVEIEIDFDTLDESIHNFNVDCQEYRNLTINTRNTYLHIYKAGITKFESETDEQEKYKKLLAVYHNMDNEKEAIEREARVALTTVAATIKGLREDLQRLVREMYNFNRGIWRQQVSNLKEFKIEVVERKTVVEHIDRIIATSNLYESGDNLDLLNAHYTTDDKPLDEAKDYIIKYASEKGGLKLSDLFDVRFKVVNRNDEVDYYDKIDSAGSNGTRITIKLLCGMLFIRHLLTDKDRAAFRIPIYIDEAADIDPQNQKAIIKTALNFGFVPIFASVKPQTSCHYVVPIRTIRQGTQNWVDEKDWIELESSEEDQAEVVEDAVS